LRILRAKIEDNDRLGVHVPSVAGRIARLQAELQVKREWPCK
jgi:hypothetical protein